MKKTVLTLFAVLAAAWVSPAAADFVLGNAAECGESSWVGGASDLAGEFNVPAAAAIDGQRRMRGWRLTRARRF